MNRDEDNFDTSAIDDLIQYDEDDTPDTEEISDTAEEAFDTEEEAFDTEETYAEEPEIPYEELSDSFDEDDFIYEKKGIKKGIIIGAVIGIIAVISFISIDSGIIGNYKNNFAKNFSSIFKNFKSDSYSAVQTTSKSDTQYKTDIKNNTIVSIEEAVKTEFAPYKDGIVFANMNHLTYLDNAGNIVWETDTAVVDPILKAEGNYIMLAENGGNKICLYGDRRLIYDVNDADTIIAAELSSVGDVVAITDKSSYKGGISVYNKSGARIFSWASGGSMVISADISAASRRVAVATLNTENTVGTTVQLFDVNKTDSYAKLDIAGTVVFDMEFTGDLLTAFGDNRITGISAGGRLLYDNAFESEQLTHSAIDANGNKLLSLDNGNIPMINMYNKKGKLKSSVTLTGVTDFIDISDKNILYNLGRDVYFGKVNSNDIGKYTATMDIKKLIITGKNSFVIVYSNSIEIVTV